MISFFLLVFFYHVFSCFSQFKLILILIQLIWAFFNEIHLLNSAKLLFLLLIFSFFSYFQVISAFLTILQQISNIFVIFFLLFLQKSYSIKHLCCIFAENVNSLVETFIVKIIKVQFKQLLGEFIKSNQSCISLHLNFFIKYLFFESLIDSGNKYPVRFIMIYVLPS